MHSTFPHFENYVWKNGIPRGKRVVDCPTQANISYRIVHDPYYKRISIERYQKGLWKDIVYDSLSFDFRIIRQSNHEKQIQEEWERIPLQTESNETLYLIRNREDRPIYIEKMTFEDSRPRQCTIYSPQRQLLATHTLWYEDKKDPFNGVIVYDQLGKAVVKKIYEFDKEECQFTTLISEHWALE